jgi:hypothetical protein
MDAETTLQAVLNEEPVSGRRKAEEDVAAPSPISAETV